jgi:hypothetical protein
MYTQAAGRCVAASRAGCHDHSTRTAVELIVNKANCGALALVLSLAESGATAAAAAVAAAAAWQLHSGVGI